MPAPLLASYRQSSTDDLGPVVDVTRSGQGCVRMAGMAFLSLSSGASFAARCGRNGCPYCLQKNADRRAAAIALAAPDRAMLLTQVGREWSDVRRNVNRFREYLKRKDVAVGEWVWHVEPNPAGTGHHVHAWQHGRTKLPSAWVLSEVAGAVGIGVVVRVNRVRSTVGAASYGLKGVRAMGYGLKGTAEGGGYLPTNGGRLTHQSRSFFRVDGRPVPVRVAERLAMRALFPSADPGPWRLVTVGSAEWWPANITRSDEGES